MRVYLPTLQVADLLPLPLILVCAGTTLLLASGHVGAVRDVRVGARKCTPGTVGARVCARYSVHSTNRTFVTDKSSSFSFLVDSGASVSVMPISSVRPHQRSAPLPKLALQEANGSIISVYGSCSFALDLGFGRLFCWVFLLADVQQAILGANFLSHFALLVNCTHHCLLDSTRRTVCTLRTA